MATSTATSHYVRSRSVLGTVLSTFSQIEVINTPKRVMRYLTLDQQNDSISRVDAIARRRKRQGLSATCCVDYIICTSHVVATARVASRPLTSRCTCVKPARDSVTTSHSLLLVDNFDWIPSVRIHISVQIKYVCIQKWTAMFG